MKIIPRPKYNTLLHVLTMPSPIYRIYVNRDETGVVESVVNFAASPEPPFPVCNAHSQLSHLLSRKICVHVYVICSKSYLRPVFAITRSTPENGQRDDICTQLARPVASQKECERRRSRRRATNNHHAGQNRKPDRHASLYVPAPALKEIILEPRQSDCLSPIFPPSYTCTSVSERRRKQDFFAWGERP